MLILRIKQAESALDDGRLDEAYELFEDDELRQHRRGQELIGRLVRDLIKRGRDHLSAQRLQQGLADCHKAEKLGGNIPEIAELRSLLGQAIAEKNQQDRQQTIRLAQARQHVDQGWPSAAEQVLAEGGPSDNEAGLVLQQAAARRMEIDLLVNKAQQAIDQGDLETPIVLLVGASTAHKNSKKISDLIAQIKTTALTRIRDYINGGRIDLAQSLLEKLTPLAPEALEIQELSRVLSQCRQARQFLDNGHPRQALSVLKQIKSIIPSAEWLNAAIKDAGSVAEALESLRIGPLGLVISSEYWPQNHEVAPVQKQAKSPAEQPAKPPAAPAHHQPSPGQAMPARFVVQVDGVGSYLVLREPSVTVGPISSSRQPMLGLVADPNMPVATIERAEEDYFLRTEDHLQVNDKPVTEHLLINGDRIAFSPRCRMKFQLPNAASTTAALTFMGARLPRADMKQALLLDRELIIGPGASAHIRAARAANSVVLFLRDGRLFCRTNESVTIDGRPAGADTPLPLGATIKIGQISLVLTKE